MIKGIESVEEAHSALVKARESYIHPRINLWPFDFSKESRLQEWEKASRNLQSLLRVESGIFPLRRMSLLINPQTEGGIFYFDYDVVTGGERFTVPYRKDRKEGLLVQRSQSGRRFVEVPSDLRRPILHLPENTQVLIHLRHKTFDDNPMATVEFERLAGHWVPELTDEPRLVTLTEGVQVQSEQDTSWPPPLIRETQVIL